MVPFDSKCDKSSDSYTPSYVSEAVSYNYYNVLDWLSLIFIISL